MDRQKVTSDWILGVQDTIYVLNTWLGLLESWRESGRAEPDDFMDACGQLREANLWPWAQRAGGHGLEALAAAVQVSDIGLDERMPR